MRVAVFTNQFPSRVSTFFVRDMYALMESGLEVDIFTIYPLDAALWRYVPLTSDGKSPLRDRVHHLSLAESIRRFRPWPVPAFVRFLRTATAVSASAARFGFSPFLKSGYVLPKGWVWAQHHAQTYDHVLAYWGNYAATCAYMFQILSQPGVPFSMFLHAGTDLYRDPVYLRQKLLYADNIIVVCEFNKQFIQQHYADIYDRIEHKIVVHHLGLDFAEFAYRPEGRKENLILAVGLFDKRKGFEVLIRAVHQLQKRGIAAELDLIGDGEQAAALKELSDTLGTHVRFRGWLPFEEVRSAMHQTTLLVHPSTELGDAVPTVIKESIALGSPVVASNLAGIPELLDRGQCGILVPPNDVDALTNAIEEMLQNTELRRHYARAGRQYAEGKLDLWKNGDKLAQLLKSSWNTSAKMEHGQSPD